MGIAVTKSSKYWVLHPQKGLNIGYCCHKALYENQGLQYNYNSNYNMGEGLHYISPLFSEKKRILPSSVLFFEALVLGLRISRV